HALPLSSQSDVGDTKPADNSVFGYGLCHGDYNAGIPPRLVAGDFLARGPNQPSQLFLESIESHDKYDRSAFWIDGYRRVYRLFDFDADLKPTKLSESTQDYPQSPIMLKDGCFDYNRYNDILLKGNLAGGLGQYSDRDWAIVGGPDYNS